MSRILQSSLSDADPATANAAHQTELQALRQPASHLEIGDPLGKGGMGQVHAARDQRLGRTVAIKRLLPERKGQPQAVARFLAEARIAASLEHPGIVPVFEIGVDSEGEVFYTMRRIDGESLGAVLERLAKGDSETVQQYQLTKLLGIFQQVCDAVAYAHARGVIHRDLKPENIMLGPFGQVVVMDWGLAKVLEDAGSGEQGARSKEQSAGGEEPSAEREESGAGSGNPGLGQTQANTIMGSFGFMAPEVARGGAFDADARADIYGLGAILYQMLTLRPPIRGREAGLMLDRTKTGDIRPATEFNPGGPREVSRVPLLHCPGQRIPGALSAIAMKAMALESKDRYQRVLELQRDIQAYQGGFVTTAEGGGVLQQLGLLIKRHRREFSIAAGSLAILVAAATTSVIKVTRTLSELRGTAPTFYNVAVSLMVEQKFDEALQKINYGLTLAPGNAEYHNLKGRILEALLRLKEAHSEFAQALHLDPQIRGAEENRQLCEKLIRDNAGRKDLSPESLRELYHLMIRQGRSGEAVALMARIGQSKQFMLETWKALLERAGIKVAGRLKLNDQDQLELNLNEVPISDLSPLKGMPLSSLGVGYNDHHLKDISPLKGMALTRLDLLNTDVSDLRPLEGMPLEWLDARGILVLDLSPLKNLPLKDLLLDDCPKLSDIEPLEGMQLNQLNLSRTKVVDFGSLRHLPLKSLGLRGTTIADLSVLAELPLAAIDVGFTRITNLEPLQRMSLSSLDINTTPISNLSALANMPLDNWLTLANTPVNDIGVLRGKSLRQLDISNTRVSDISVLRNMPIQELRLDGCKSLKDISPLADCRQLQRLALPSQCENIEFLRSFTNLVLLTYFTGANFNETPVPTNQTPAEFWKAYDARKR